MFEDALKEWESTLDVPYPERLYLMRELKSDMSEAFDEFRLRGLGEVEARLEVMKLFAMDYEDSAALKQVYRSRMQKIGDSLPCWLSSALKDGALVGLLLLTGYFLFVEVPMIDFVMAGGLPAQFVILLTAIIGFSIQGIRAVKWFVLKDHSTDSLNSNTATPLYLAGLVFVLGCLGTAIGYYVVFSKWASSVISDFEFKVGMSEPLSCTILALALVSMMLAIHLATQVKLRSMGISKCEVC